MLTIEEEGRDKENVVKELRKSLVRNQLEITLVKGNYQLPEHHVGYLD